MPATTDTVVSSRRPPSESSPTVWSTFTTAPESSRIVSQESVRIRYVTKNGTITASSSALRQRPARNAIT
jgi:hypothetical protein